MFFLLAAFMMVSIQMSKTENIKVHLPSASQSRQDFRPDMVNIAVDKSGAVWLEKKAISLAGLGLALSNRFRRQSRICRSISAATATRCMATW